MGEKNENTEQPSSTERPLDEQSISSRKRIGLSGRSLPIKDIATITLSLLAFIISSCTAYLSIFRTEENASVIMNKHLIAIQKNNDTLYIPSDAEGELTFINSGNRAIAITRVTLSYTQSTKGIAPECSEESSAHFYTDFQPTVLKPNDIIVSKFRISKPIKFYDENIEAKRDISNAFSFSVHPNNSLADGNIVDICLTVSLATPSESKHTTTLPIYRYQPTTSVAVIDPREIGRYFSKPAVLIRNVGTIFGK
jgi:hypothetical protein